MLSTDHVPLDDLGSAEHVGDRERPPLAWLRLTGHFLEMVVAMAVGMVVLGWALHAFLGAVGAEYSPVRHPELVILEMGLTAAVGVVVWMRLRGRGWARAVEMSGAALVPAAAVLPPMWLGLADSMTALVVEHVAMVPLALAVVLRRRAEYLTPRPGRVVPALRRIARAAARRRGVRVIGRVGLVVLAVLVLPVGWGLANSAAYEADRYTATPASASAARAVATATAPGHVPGRPTAVVVVGNRGANVADTLAPYAVLQATGAFNVYLVAPERRPVPLLGGLDVVPDLSFADLGARLGGSAPDITVVPEMPANESSDRPVTTWLRDVASHGLVLGVCTGARLMADAGLLDNHGATSHWYRLAALEKAHPEVRWQRGVRYVDDGDVITTGGLLSSVDGTLRVVERVIGTDAAAAAARAVAWKGYSPGRPATLPLSSLAPTEAILHLINTGFRANGTTVGVVLTDGVGELELAAAFAPYAEVKSARTLALARGGDPIRSRHGLTFVPRADLASSTAEGVDRLLDPGASTTSQQQAGFAFDEPLREMARRMDVPTATWTAKLLELPTAGLGLAGPSWPWLPTAVPVALGLAGLAAALVSLRVARWLRTRRP